MTADRRHFLQAAVTLAAASHLPRALAQERARINPPALFENHVGGYFVLPGGGVFSGAAVAMPGFEIVHALVEPWIPLTRAWAFIEGHLSGLNRPVKALCGMELRIPQQLTIDGFRAFNVGYVEQLQKWDLLIGRYSAVCRTNVAPSRDIPAEASVHAFSYCIPSATTVKTFCVSGAADIDPRGRPVAEGDTSPAGMKRRLQHVAEAITGRLAEIEMDWSNVTHADVCMANKMPDLLKHLREVGVDPAPKKGVRIYAARPPIIGSEVELECRGILKEVVVSA